MNNSNQLYQQHMDPWSANDLESVLGCGSARRTTAVSALSRIGPSRRDDPPDSNGTARTHSASVTESDLLADAARELRHMAGEGDDGATRPRLNRPAKAVPGERQQETLRVAASVTESPSVNGEPDGR